MSNLGSWNTNAPSGTSLLRDFDDLYRSDKSLLTGALNEEHYFESASSASAALHRPGSAVVFAGATSAISTVAKAGTRPMYDTTTGKLHVISSTSTLAIKVDPSDIRQASAATGDALVWSGSAWAPGSGATAFVGARIYATSVQTFANSTPTEVTWGAASRNSQSYWTSAAPAYMTVPAGFSGMHRLKCRHGWNASAAGDRLTFFKKNGASMGAAGDRDLIAGSAAAAEANFIETVAYLASGDTVAVNAQQSAGGDLGNRGSTDGEVNFEIEFLGT